MGCFRSSVSLGELSRCHLWGRRLPNPTFPKRFGKDGFLHEIMVCSGFPVGSRDSGRVGDNQSSFFAGEAAFFLFPWEEIGVGRQWFRCFLGEMRPTAPLSPCSWG